LKDDYNLFLDTEATFDLHNLEVLVAHTKVFFFFLTDGILDSFWCLQGISLPVTINTLIWLELRAAIKANVRVIVIKHYQYIPVYPDSANDVRNVIENAPTYIYHPEDLGNCLDSVRHELGPKDSIIQQIEKNTETIVRIKEESSSISIDCGSKTIYLYDILHALQKHYGYPLNKLHSLTALNVHLSQKCFEFANSLSIKELHLISNDSHVSDDTFKNAFNLKSLTLTSISILVSFLILSRSRSYYRYFTRLYSKEQF
jgi:hypothetical protein